MRLGTAKLTITPLKPVRMCGYATRTLPFEGVAEDIWLRVHFLESEETGRRAVFIYGDLLWWNSRFVERVRPAAAGLAGTPEESIFFVASHNHSGPGTGDCFTPLLETCDEEYAQWLRSRVLEGIRRSAAQLEPVEIRRFNGDCAMNVFRRKWENGKIAMKPNYQAEADRNLTIAAFIRKDGSLKGTMIHYPCHANLSDKNVIQPDYPGAALRMMDQNHPGSISIFLQGCTADLRPNSVLGERFTACGYEKVQDFAGEFYQCCEMVMAGCPVPVRGSLEMDRISLKLPLVRQFTRAQVQRAAAESDQAVSQWANKVLEKDMQDSETLEISLIRFGKGLDLFTFNGEVSQDYAAFARQILPGGICAGYTNGMIGYICTREQIGEGGYEPKDSALYFALAGTFAPEIEQMIHDRMEELCGSAEKEEERK